ncbi:MAG: MBL fold metallo-hydrolase, partial [Candidatus Latescibacterota bacterium]
VSTDTQKILIDALFDEGFGRYLTPSLLTRRKLTRAKPPFDNVDLILVTHWHGDHFNAKMVADHLKNNPRGVLVAPQQVVEKLKERKDFAKIGRQVEEVTPATGAVVKKTINNIEMKILGMKHVPYPIDGVDKHARVQVLGFLVTIGGVTFLHAGDAIYDLDEEFIALSKIDREHVDILFIEYFDRSENSANIVQNVIRPDKIIGMHVPPSDIELVEDTFRQTYPGGILFGKSMEKKQIAVSPHGSRDPVIFASYAQNEEQLHHTLILTESIRTFAGKFQEAPIWLFMPDNLARTRKQTLAKLDTLNVEVKVSDTPKEALPFYFAGKTFAAAKCEALAEGRTRVLIWMDEDTVVLTEPTEVVLDEGISLGYRPVMHKNIGSLYEEPLDQFWARVYEKLGVSDDAVFPMVTVASRETLRPYFNAGLLVVRPERGILKKWAESFRVLYGDPVFVEMVEEDMYKRIFLHQAALSGAILNRLRREEMTELPRKFNYPLFFKQMHGAEEEFDSIDGVVSFRYDVYFKDPDPNWSKKLKGDPQKITWLAERLGKR